VQRVCCSAAEAAHLPDIVADNLESRQKHNRRYVRFDQKTVKIVMKLCNVCAGKRQLYMQRGFLKGAM